MRIHSLVAIIVGASIVAASYAAVGQWGQSDMFSAARLVRQNGRCGSANGVATSTAPTSGLCSVGKASAVTGTGPWNWTCAGIAGGTPASCSAPSIPPGSLLPAPPSGQSWVTVFNEDFAAGSVDHSKWFDTCSGACTTPSGDHINNAQTISFSNGHMVYTELNDAFGTGAEISSNQGFGNGYFETRIVPGDGWSLFWLFPKNSIPDCGGDRSHGFEADIWENAFSGVGGQHAYHWNGYASCHQADGCTNLGLSLSTEYVIGLWWTGSNLTTYVNGVQDCQIGGPNGNFLQEIRLTVAGCPNGGGTVCNSIPTRYDWVRVFQLQ